MGIRGWRCLVVGRLRGREAEIRVIKKLRDGMWVLVKLKVYESKKLGGAI